MDVLDTEKVACMEGVNFELLLSSQCSCLTSGQGSVLLFSVVTHMAVTSLLMHLSDSVPCVLY